MKVVQINATCGIGSTGKICVGISKVLTASNIENYILYSNKTNGYPLGIACASDKYIEIQALKSKLLGNYGFNSKKATQKMIDEIERIQPDIIHLHNIHGHDCNLEMLFTYFKENKKKIFWTFHDCWVFTGYCPHFTMVKCDKWKTACSECVQKHEFSWFYDKSYKLFCKKKNLFMGLDLTIITPSKWLFNIVKMSFLKDYPVFVINNGINLTSFKPTPSDFREKYGVALEKKIILGVAFDWGKRKGLDVYINLAKKLDPNKYQIVLVGTNKKVDKQLEKNIISIHKTADQHELAKIYTVADIFLNPTREENFPTVNIEALACGTPVITFNTGGSIEIIDDESGDYVECDDIEALFKSIVNACENRFFSTELCRERALQFNENDKIFEYINLYRRFLHE